MSLPYSAHPLYNLRKASIIIAIIGVILCCLSSGSYSYYDGTLTTSTFWLAISAIFCTADLLLYAIQKVKKPDEDPEWPTLRWMMGDAVLAGILLFMFAAVIGHLAWQYRPDISGLYGVLANLLCSALHAWAFWKQLMARYKKKWLAGLVQPPCQQCGHVDVPTESMPSPTAGNGQVHPSSASYHEPMYTPGSTESTMEEGLLIGSDYDGYGSIDDQETQLEQPEEVVVAKRSKKAGNASGKQPVKKTTVQVV